MRKTFFLLFSTLFLCFALYTNPHLKVKALQALFLEFPVMRCFLILIVQGINFFLVCARSKLIYQNFGYLIPYPLACKATLSGQISGLFLPLAGSIVGQGATLSAAAVPADVTPIVCLYEKLILAVTGIFLSLIALNYFWDGLLSNILAIILPCIEILLVLGLIFSWFYWKDLNISEKNRLTTLFSYQNIFQTCIIASISCVTWILSATSFLIVILYFDPSVFWLQILAASIVISFLASLPISISGWGVREFAAIQLLGYLGISPNIAIFSAINIGILSLCVLIIISLIPFLKILYQKNSLPKPNTPSKAVYPSFKQSSQAQIIYKMMAYMTAVLLFFQSRITYEEYQLNVNGGDILALCALGLFFSQPRHYMELFQFQIPKLKHYILSLIFIMCLALIIGLYQFGFTPWAFFSRFLGFFMLLGYALIAIYYMHFTGDQNFSRISNLMISSMSIIIIWSMLRTIANKLNLLSINLADNFEGFANNRNAFAFQCLAVISLAHIAYARISSDMKIEHKTFFKFKKEEWILGLLYTGLFLTYSRTGFIVASFLLMLFWICRIHNVSQIIRFSITTLILLTLYRSINAMPQLFDLINATFNFNLINGTFNFNLNTLSNLYLPSIADYNSSDTHRWYTIIQGLSFWLENPIFGKGLGAFMHQEMTLKGEPLTIHNTFVWFLAEFGLSGALIFLSFGWAHLRYLYIRQKNFSRMEFHLLALILIFSLFAMTHDVFYQRILWFIWGFCVAHSSTYTTSTSTSTLCKKVSYQTYEYAKPS